MSSLRLALIAILVLVSVSETEAGFPPSIRLVEANIAVTSDPNFRQQVEPTIAIDPADYRVIVAGAQDLRGFPEFGDRWHGYYRSTDGGATWTNQLVPGYPTDNSPAGLASPIHGANFTSDPVLAFDGLGNVYYSGLHVWDLQTLRGGVFVAKYREHGATYDFTRIVFDRQGVISDKNWIAVDTTKGPFSGSVYVAWSATYRCCPSQERVILFSRSTDGGQSYSSPLTIQPVVGTHAIGVQIAVSPNGDVYVSWVAYPSSGGGAQIYMARSTDGGKTFGGNRLVQNIVPIPSPLPGNLYRTFTLHAMSTGNVPGEVYVIWEEWVSRGTSSDADIFLVKSVDGGVTWSPRVRVNDSIVNNQFFPAISVSDDAVNVIFYDSRNDFQNERLDIYYAQSLDDGLTFRLNIRVTDRSFDPNIVPRTVNPGATQPFMGDYIGIASTSTEIHPIWTDNRNVDLSAGVNSGRYNQDAFTATLKPELKEAFRFDWTDYDNDGSVAINDIAAAAIVFDKADNYWDFDLSGRVDINDIALAAIRFDHQWESVPFPGLGQLAGKLDTAWKSLCGQLPQPDQAYCQTIP